MDRECKGGGGTSHNLPRNPSTQKVVVIATIVIMIVYFQFDPCQDVHLSLDNNGCLCTCTYAQYPHPTLSC